MRQVYNSRRSVLAAVGCIGSIPVVASGSEDETPEEPQADAAPGHEDRFRSQGTSGSVAAREEGFDNVVDIVDAGADNTGTQSIQPVLNSVLRDDTLVTFPPGTYLLTDSVRLAGFSNVGLVGRDATIRIGPYGGFSDEIAFKLGVPDNPGDGLLFESFTFDQRGSNRGVKAIQSTMNDGLRIRDILVRGQHDTLAESGGTFNIADPDGRGVVQRFRFPDGTLPIRTSDGSRVVAGRSGITTNVNHVGTLWYRDCIVRSCHDNGMYVTGGGGTVAVQGGVFQNNNVSNVRIGGANSAIEGVQVIVDQNDVDSLNQRGIRLDAGANVMIDNVDIRLTRPNGDAITVLNGVDSATITDTTVFMGDRASRGIRVSENSGPVRITDTSLTNSGPTEGGAAISLPGASAGTTSPVVVENTTVTGDASGQTGGREGILVDRDNVTFRNVTVDQPGTNLRQGINIGGDNCNVINCSIQARHYPLVVRGGNGLVQSSELRSHGGYQAIRFYDGSSAQVFDNVLKNGINVSSTASVTRRGNEYL